MNYEEARAYLNTISAKGNRLGLESTRELLKELGNPQDELKFIHIAGTNGKGSVMTYLDFTLREAGLKIGRYISPVLFCYEEKIQVNGKYIEKEALARLTGKIREAVGAIEKRGGPLPTIFEVETAVSFLYFLENRCDLVLLETGMGGREDATNVVKTTVMEMISSISMDHMEYLGDTIAKIAWNKAGIIKPGTEVVSDMQLPEAMDVIREVCARQGAFLHTVDPAALQDVNYGLTEQRFSYRDHTGMTIHLAGVHQIRNAALALEGVDALRRAGYDISEESVRRGFEAARWEGRFQVLRENPCVIIDGAHNPDAAARLMDSVRVLFPERRLIYIFGVFSDKEYDKIIRITAPYADRIYTIETRDNPRALPAGKLAQAVRAVNPNVECAGYLPEAFDLAMERAAPEDVILIFGSLSFLWEAKEYVR